MKSIGCFLFIVGLSIITSCRPSICKSMDMAESIISYKPDSALYILNQISPEQIQTQSQRARYALLNSMALDKNYIDVTDDSLITIAVQYYTSKGTAENKMKSLYYQGLVRKNAGRYTAAVVSLEQARQLAEDLCEWHYVGLINRTMSSIYNSCNNTVSAIKYQSKAIDAFTRNNEPIYEDYAKYSLAVLYNNGLRLDSAKTVLTELMNKSIDETLNHYVNLCYAGILVQMEDSIPRAISIYQSTPDRCFDIQDYGMYSLASFYNGNRDSADYYFAKAYSLSNSSEQSASLDYLHADYDSKIGHYKEAYDNIFKASLIQDSLTRVLLSQSLTNAQLDYYKQETSLQKRIATQQRIIKQVIVVCSLLIVTIIILVSLSWRKRQEARIKDSLVKLSVSNHLNARLTGVYCYEKMTKLSELANSYISSDNSQDQEIAFKELKQLAKDIQQSSKFFELLSAELNKNCQGVINKLHSQIPSIKGDNLKIITLFFSGFSAAQIAIIMGRPSSGSVRTLKSRLRDTIRNSCAQDSNLFLDLLED